MNANELMRIQNRIAFREFITFLVVMLVLLPFYFFGGPAITAEAGCALFLVGGMTIASAIKLARSPNPESYQISASPENPPKKLPSGE